MFAGRLLYRVTVLRRSVVAGNPGGSARGVFERAFETRAGVTQGRAVKAIEAGVVEDQSRIVLHVYDCARNRTITVADRLVIEGPSHPEGEWSIDAVAVPHWAKNMIEITATRTKSG